MPTSKDYWDGYRAAQIYVLLEGIESVAKFPRIDGTYQTGFDAGLQAMREKLNEHIHKERKLRRV